MLPTSYLKKKASIILGILYAWEVVGSLQLCPHVFTQSSIEYLPATPSLFGSCLMFVIFNFIPGLGLILDIFM